MQRFIKVFFILFFPLFIQNVWGQGAVAWKNFTAMKKINDALITEKGIWCGTDGGAFYYNFADSSYKTYNKLEGLNGTSVTALAKDKYNKIWFGSANGIIDVYDPASNSFKRIMDIYNSGKTLSAINSLYALGDTVFASTDFGLCLINASSYFFVDSYIKFGNLASNIKVKQCFKSDAYFVSIEGGIVKQKDPNAKIVSPDSWEDYSNKIEINTTGVNKILMYRDTLLIATDEGIDYFDKDTFRVYLPDFKTYKIDDLFARNDSLFILSYNVLYCHADSATPDLNTDTRRSTKIISATGNYFYTATDSGLAVIQNGIKTKAIFPNSPEVSYSTELTVDNNSNLWVASGSSNGEGFFKYDGEKWTNYNKAYFPALPGNSFFRVSCTADGKIYAGSWGTGFLRMTSDSTFSVFDTHNSPLTGISGNPKFLVIAGLKNDSKNNTWVLNYDASNQKPLNVLTKDSVWYTYTNPSNSFSSLHTNLLIDQYDTKWFVAENPQALYYFNENSTLKDTTDDKSGVLTALNDLNGAKVTCIALDTRGDIWVGTALGVEIVTNTYSILNSKASLKVLSVYSLRQQTINCMAVDALNQKWVGTNQGLILVTSDGASIIKTYNSANSSLLSDEIKSIAIDEKTGTVFVGTDEGISSFTTTFSKPVDSFTNLTVYPNPLIIDGSGKSVTVDGLVKDSELKILTVSGKLVNTIITDGGRIGFWNGKDSDGKYVGTGVYFIVAYDKDGNHVTTSKVAVIRKK